MTILGAIAGRGPDDRPLLLSFDEAPSLREVVAAIAAPAEWPK